MSQQLTEDISALEDLAERPDDPITLEQCRHIIDDDDDGITIEPTWSLSYRLNQNIHGTHYRLRQFCGYQLQNVQEFPRTDEGWQQLVIASGLENHLACMNNFGFGVMTVIYFVPIESLEDFQAYVDGGQMVLIPHQEGRAEFYVNQDGYRVDVYADWDQDPPFLESHQFDNGDDDWKALLESWGNFLELAISDKKLTAWRRSTIDLQEARQRALEILASML